MAADDDLGKIDEDGIITILDRKRNIVIRGGENIACLEIEGALRYLPKITGCCAFSFPDKRIDEVVGECMQIREDARTTQEELKAFIAEEIEHFKIPEIIWIQKNPLPRGGTHKLDVRTM